MHSSSSVFPIEIYEQIIEDIGQEALDPIDRSPLYRSRALKTLWSCALTCRAWVPKSNACLYRQLTFSQDDVIMRPLLQTLDAHPALRTLVTELTITRRNVTNTTRSSQAAVNASPFTRPDSVRCMLFPIIMAHRFPRLEHLRLNPDGDFYRGEETRGIIVHRAFLASLRTFRSVVKLSLCRVLFESYPDLEKILFAFPCLEIVALEDVRFRTNSSPRWLPGDRCYGGTVVAPPISQLVLTLVSLGVRPYERTPGLLDLIFGGRLSVQHLIMDYEMLTSLQAFIDANPTIGNYCMLLRSLELIQIDMCWYGRDGPAKATKSLFTFLRHAGTPALQRVMVIADFYWLDPAQIYGSDESAASGRTIPDLPPLASFVCYLHAEATPATCNMLQRQLQAIFPNALVVVIDGYCDADDRVCYYYYNGEVRIPRMTVRPSELAEAWPSRLMLREPSLRAGPSHCKVQEPTEQ